MTESQWEKYAVRKPIYEAGPGVNGRQSPTMTYMSSKQVPEVNYYVELGWIYEIPSPNPHIHSMCMIMMSYHTLGGNPEDASYWEGIDFYMAGPSLSIHPPNLIQPVLLRLHLEKLNFHMKCDDVGTEIQRKAGPRGLRKPRYLLPRPGSLMMNTCCTLFYAKGVVISPPHGKVLHDQYKHDTDQHCQLLYEFG
jgi:hypothetical protein